MFCSPSFFPHIFQFNLEYSPVVHQLVTSKRSDGWFWNVTSNSLCGVARSVFFCAHMIPIQWIGKIHCWCRCWYKILDFTVDEGMGRPNPSLAIHGEASNCKRKVERLGLAFLLCDPGWCIRVLQYSCRLEKWDANCQHHTHRSQVTYRSPCAPLCSKKSPPLVFSSHMQANCAFRSS